MILGPVGPEIRVAELLSQCDRGTADEASIISLIASAMSQVKLLPNVADVDRRRVAAEGLMRRGKIEDLLEDGLLQKLTLKERLKEHFLLSLVLSSVELLSSSEEDKLAEEDTCMLQTIGSNFVGAIARVAQKHMPPSRINKAPVMSKGGRPLRTLIGSIAVDCSLSFDIAFQEDRNPTLTGFSLLFTSKDKRRRTRAYMLIESSSGENWGSIDEFVEGREHLPASRKRPGCKAEAHTTTWWLRGMHVDTDLRGRGLSRILLSTWLLLCWKAGAFPATRRINKPLLSLALERDFLFKPINEGTAVQVQVLQENTFGKQACEDFSLDSKCSNRISSSSSSSDSNKGANKVYIHSLEPERVLSILSKSEMMKMNIELIDTTVPRPSARSRTAHINASFAPPEDRKKLLRIVHNTFSAATDDRTLAPQPFVKLKLFAAKLIWALSGFSSQPGANVNKKKKKELKSQ